MKHAAKLTSAIIAVLLIALAAGCGKTERPAATTSGQNSSQSAATIVRAAYNADSPVRAELMSERPEIKAGEAASLSFRIKDQSGAIFRNLKIVHEKPMHLLVVSNDLAEFDHVHPELQPDGTFKVAYTFPHGGVYKLYADFTPQGARQVVERYDVNVSGPERQPIPLVADVSLTKTVESLSVTMFPDKALRAGQELMLNFAVADAQTGKPVTDLEKYLGAMAHFVIISEDLTDFLHVHPMEPGEMMKPGEHGETKSDMGDMKMGETSKTSSTQGRAIAISAHTTFPRAGVYKLWAQFQRGGRVINVPFIVRVDAIEAPVASTQQGPAPLPNDAITVTVSGAGFEPSQIQAKKGQPLKLAFYRADEQNCAGEVVFPSLNVRKKLPVGQTTIVEVTPKKSGDLAFGCGMGMFSGTLVVTD